MSQCQALLSSSVSGNLHSSEIVNLRHRYRCGGRTLQKSSSQSPRPVLRGEAGLGRRELGVGSCLSQGQPSGDSGLCVPNPGRVPTAETVHQVPRIEAPSCRLGASGLYYPVPPPSKQADLTSRP